MDYENYTVDESLWTDRKGTYWEYLCPNCKGPKRLFSKPTPYQFKYFFRILLLSLVSALCLWPLFQEKGFVLFLPLWTVFEVAFRIRIRGQIFCSRCGFDPTLFVRDSKLAKEEIRRFWEVRGRETGIVPKDLEEKDAESQTEKPVQNTEL